MTESDKAIQRAIERLQDAGFELRTRNPTWAHPDGRTFSCALLVFSDPEAEVARVLGE